MAIMMQMQPNMMQQIQYVPVYIPTPHPHGADLAPPHPHDDKRKKLPGSKRDRPGEARGRLACPTTRQSRLQKALGVRLTARAHAQEEGNTEEVLKLNREIRDIRRQLSGFPSRKKMEEEAAEKAAAEQGLSENMHQADTHLIDDVQGVRQQDSSDSATDDLFPPADTVSPQLVFPQAMQQQPMFQQSMLHQPMLHQPILQQQVFQQPMLPQPILQQPILQQPTGEVVEEKLNDEVEELLKSFKACFSVSM